MKLLYDLYCTQPSKSAVHGGGVYGQTLFAALVDSPKIKSGEVKVSVLLHPDKPLPDSVTELIRSNGIEVLPCRSNKDILLHLNGDAFELSHECPFEKNKGPVFCHAS